MMRKIRLVVPIVGLGVVLGLGLAAVGCADTGQQTGPAVATATPVLQLDVPQAVESRLEEIRDSILTRAAELGQNVDASDLDVVDIVRREWPTAALGCPKPGQSYAQVVTSGYALRVDAGQTTYEVHVSDGGDLVVCEPAGQAGTATPVPGATPTVAPAAAVEQFVEQARAALEQQVEQLGAADVLDVQRMEWPSAAMGCPEPGKSYAQVVTPGYAISFGAGDTRYEVHVSQSGQAVVCGDGTQRQAEPTPAAANGVTAAVVEDLASRLDVAEDDLTVVGVDGVEWRDSSLGCPEPGRMYAQVITPGYRVVVQGPEATYEYHTDRSGDQMVLCQQPAGAEQRLGPTQARQVAERARQALANRLGVDASTISVAEVTPLALVADPAPCPGADSLSGGGPAYQLRLEVDQQSYVYRLAGDQLLMCSP